MKRCLIYTFIVVMASGIVHANPCLGLYTDMPHGVAGPAVQDTAAASINESTGSVRIAQVTSGPQGYGTVPGGWGVPSGYSPVPAGWGVPSGYGPSQATSASQGSGATGPVAGGSTPYQGSGSSSKPGASKE
jgi:hypothetical protein